LAGETIEGVRDQLMGVEGNAARHYWEAIRTIVPEEYNWQTREGRGATDPINSLLNYGYGILYGQIERALVLAGLDPYAGFVHADRPGKPSLVLDLIEEFRQVGVDRVVFGLVNRRFNIEQDERGRMSEDTRRAFAQHILDHLESNVRYEGKKYPLRSVIQMQARQIVTFVRRERSEYVPFKASW
jgi:CRISPR-associated protein Cas1